MVADTPAQATLFIFFLLVHIMVLHSAEERCTPDFCNDVVGFTHFPFRTTRQPPECGLYTLDCANSSGPRIQLKEEGYWHQLENFPLTSTIGIKDTDLDKRFRTDSCNDELLDKLSLPIASPTLDVFLVTHNLTVFKYNNTVDRTFTDRHALACKSAYHTYYYTPSRNSLPSPPPCSIILLPVRAQSSGLNALSTTFYLEVKIPKCYRCLGKKGECLVDKGKFECIGAKGDKLALKLGLGVVAGLMVVVVVVVVICCLRMKLSSHRFIFFSKKHRENRQVVEGFLESYGPLQVRRYSYSEVKKMTYSFKEKLGQGGYGSVYKGKLNDGCLVAVKVLSKVKGNGEEFMNEVAAISKTSHVNIVTLLGFCIEGSQRALIYEFMPNGSLEKFIFDANNPQKIFRLAWRTLDRISLGIARGLEYLHRGCNTRILHFDIKPHNILLDENFTPKIADFGLAKICNAKESIVSMLCARGTAGYIAPEVFCRNFGGVSHKSDVYSYGMMLSEMVGGRKNIDVGVEDTSEIYFPHWIYKRIELDEELGLQSNLNDEDRVRARKMIIVSLWCIQTDPSNRPAMKQVIEMLEGSADALQIPPKPYLTSPPKSTADSSATLASIQ